MPILPRRPLLNPNLTRPNWLQSVPRSVAAIWLDKNENLDPELLAFNESILHELDPINLSIYPECGELYRKLGRWLDVPPEAILLTPGSDGAIRLIFEAWIEPGDVVVHTSPTFAMYQVYSQMFGATAVPITYKRVEDAPILNFQDLVDHLITNKPRLLCLPNPDSPTGTVIESMQLLEIIKICASQETMVLIDEAYHPFYEPTCASLTQEYRNLIVARTFAKAWGLAGLRIGYAVGHPETMVYLHKLRPMYEVNSLSIAFMERMIDFPQEMMASVERLNRGKLQFERRMIDLGLTVLRTHGSFLHVSFGRHAAAVHAALEGWVLYRKDFKEDCLRGYSRFSATTVEQFTPIITAIRDVVENEIRK